MLKGQLHFCTGVAQLDVIGDSHHGKLLMQSRVTEPFTLFCENFHLLT